jgi:serine protease Do
VEFEEDVMQLADVFGRAGAGWRATRLGLGAAALVLAGWMAGGTGVATPAAVERGPMATVVAPLGAPGESARVDSYAEVVGRVTPAVVTIRTERRAAPRQTALPFDDPVLRRFFGDRWPGPHGGPAEPQRGLGSGVMVGTEGHVLTNHHVIDGAEVIRVELSDRRVVDATLVGSDPPSDLAVLQIAAEGLSALPLGDSDAVRVGDVVLALGNPLGVGQTVTMGIVSAKSRATGLGDGSFEDFLQTDAAINRGNSGGPLVNTRGELVGINSQIMSPSGGNVGIGFAIPSNMASQVMRQLVEHGRVERAMLGVTVQPVTSDIAAALGLSEIRGALVSGVTEAGPAARAGLTRGDIVLELDGRPIADSNALRNAVASRRPGTSVPLTILRDGRERTLTATLGELPSERTARGQESPSERGGRFGLTVEPLTPDTARRLGLAPATGGVVVTSVDPAGPAGRAGLRQGDVVEEVNGRTVASGAELREALQGAADRPSLLLVHREGQGIFVTLRP